MGKFTFALLGCVVVQAALVACQTNPLTGSHTDIPRWCGKPYEAGAPNFDPGGQLQPPVLQPSDLLFVNVAPRHSIYVSSETTAELIVDAGLSRYHGQAFTNTSSSGAAFSTLYFTVRDETTNRVILSDSVPVNTTGTLFTIPLTDWTPSLSPYPLVLSGGSSPNNTSYTAKSQLYYLPAKTSGSTVKMDHLHGGMLYANPSTNFSFQPILPFGFYTDCSNYLVSAANASAYAALGFTAINPVCALTDGNITSMFTWLAEGNVLFQYDMRNSFFNLSSVRSEVAQMKDHPGLLSWYTADEPDGWQYSFNSSTAAYDLLKQMDPYHPTGLVLNCADYYFDAYTSGTTDYIMEDAYPVGINATYSYRGTPCNATYGDCGCDNCIGSLTDVSNRLDSFRKYQEWLGRGAGTRLPVWAVQQAFSGEGYWSRNPTVEETNVMNVLAVNHGAKGVMSWIFPTTKELNEAHGAMARVVAAAPVRDFLLGGMPTRVEVGKAAFDVAYWTMGKEVLVGFANWKNETVRGTVKVPLEGNGTGIVQRWGRMAWKLVEGGLELEGVPALGTSLVVVTMGTGKRRRSGHDDTLDM